MLKIAKKKSLYIALVFVLIIIIFINAMNRYAGRDFSGSYTKQLESLKEIIAGLDPKNPSDTSSYIEVKTQIEMIELILKYGAGSWQETVIEEQLRQMIAQKNSYEYGVGEKQETEGKKEIEQKYLAYVEKLEKGDWTYFANTQLEETKQEIEQLQTQKQQIIDKVQIKQIEEQIATLELRKQVLTWRLEKDISYARSELNQEILNYEMYQQVVLRYEANPTEDYNQKVKYYQDKEKAELAKYAIEHKVSIAKTEDLRGSILNFHDQYGMVIIAVIIMIAGTIISEEFSKGTIKLLLIKPYPRWKILLAKVVACILTLLLILFGTFLAQLLVGGILFGFDSLMVPAVEYNFATNQIQEMNLLVNFAIKTLAMLPLYVLVITIAIFLGSVFTNSALAIVVALLGFMTSDLINALATSFDLWIMRFFITPNWNLTPYLFGGISEFPYTSLGFSIGMNLLYFIGMISVSCFVFQKRNIKNS